MKLNRPRNDPDHDVRALRDIDLLLQQPGFKEARPCSGCDLPCPCSRSAVCTCMCRPDCTHASLAMSSEPERYPIEAKISPLVFGFNCIRLCPPYWSCEGHLFPGGVIMRVPQVWFYSRSLIYPKLIGEFVARLKFEKAIRYPWHICVSFSDDHLETGFSIEPDVKNIGNPDLESMQADARVIAESFQVGIGKLAREYRDRYRSASA